MATYKGIQGYSVQKLSTDPTASEAAGQLWYNSTTGKFKIAIEGAGAWAAGGSLNTGRYAPGGAGTQTSALCFGGLPPYTGVTESYNGSAWTEVNNFNTARGYVGAAGASNTSALAFAGATSPTARVDNTEEWDGTSWTEKADLNTARKSGPGGTGIVTAAICFGGDGPSGRTQNTETWNGTSWTEVNNMTTTRQELCTGIGTYTAALAVGGSEPGIVGKTEKWDGTSWTASNALNTARQLGGGFGIQTAGLVAGGEVPAATNATETFDGTSWTAVANMATARGFLAAGLASPQSTGIIFAGYPASVMDPTEEWNDPVYSIKTVTVS